MTCWPRAHSCRSVGTSCKTAGVGAPEGGAGPGVCDGAGEEILGRPWQDGGGGRCRRLSRQQWLPVLRALADGGIGRPYVTAVASASHEGGDTALP